MKERVASRGIISPIAVHIRKHQVEKCLAEPDYAALKDVIAATKYPEVTVYALERALKLEDRHALKAIIKGTRHPEKVSSFLEVAEQRGDIGFVSLVREFANDKELKGAAESAYTRLVAKRDAKLALFGHAGHVAVGIQKTAAFMEAGKIRKAMNLAAATNDWGAMNYLIENASSLMSVGLKPPSGKRLLKVYDDARETEMAGLRKYAVQQIAKIDVALVDRLKGEQKWKAVFDISEIPADCAANAGIGQAIAHANELMAAVAMEDVLRSAGKGEWSTVIRFAARAKGLPALEALRLTHDNAIGELAWVARHTYDMRRGISIVDELVSNLRHTNLKALLSLERVGKQALDPQVRKYAAKRCRELGVSISIADRQAAARAQEEEKRRQFVFDVDKALSQMAQVGAQPHVPEKMPWDEQPSSSPSDTSG